jgi:hypothetical protein
MHAHTGPRFRAVAVLVGWCMLASTPAARGQDLAATSEAVAQPTEIAEPIRALLQTDATVVMRGATQLEFWWVKNIPLDTAPAAHPSWSNVPDGALVGAVRLGNAMSDIRGGPMKPGVYTLRFALQPQNGDHMGVSPYREFLLVAPAADDQSPDAAGFNGAVALAKKTLGKSHPAALGLDPPTTDQPPRAVVTNDEGHKGIVFSVPVTLQGKPAGSLTFGVTIIGQYEH